MLYPNSRIDEHNPDNKNSPLRDYLVKCAENGGGLFDEQFVAVKSYDFKTEELQKENALRIIANIEWGRNPKAILKYLLLRFL